MTKLLADSNRPPTDQILTSHEVASLLQVDRTSVNNWVREGRLAAFRTPGGHRRVRVSDLVVFATTHGMLLPDAVAGTRAKRVMIVDDEPRLLALTRRVLERHDKSLEIQTFESAIAALLSVTSFWPDLIIFDIFMPDLNGIEACRRLRARPETSDIKLVITSGALTPDLKREATELGALACLTKPFLPEQLIEALGSDFQPRAG